MLSLRGHGEMGSTFLNVLRRYVAALRAGDNTMLLIGVEARSRNSWSGRDCCGSLGGDNVFDVGGASESTRAAMDRAQQLIQSGAAPAS